MNSTQWQAAIARAVSLAQAAGHPAATWDERAVRGVLAVAIAAVAHREDRAADQVGIAEVLALLAQGPPAVYEAGRRLGLDTTDTPGDARAEWAWLTRPWPTEPPVANGGGLPRGIGRRSPLPAVDACTVWAAQAAASAEQATSA
ncbi:hypothetical protein ACFCWT_34330 [Streptomyces olivaceus]|uniref:hypothetical protein n=1 Tax=Streptomyces olivaceus TaxID=47716 RepID=UPI0035D77D6F